MQDEIPLPSEPLVDADAAVHALRAVIRDDEHRRLVVREPQEARASFGVEPPVVVEHRVLVRIAGLEQPMLGVGEAPEAVVDAVGAHLDHEEEIPGPGLEQVLCEAEPLLGHLLDLVEQAILVVGAEVLDVDEIVADDLLDLVLQLRRVRVPARPRVRGQEAGDERSVDAAGRIGLGHAEHDHVALLRREDVPDARHPHGAGVGEDELVVRVVAPVAEAVEAERARAAR